MRAVALRGRFGRKLADGRRGSVEPHVQEITHTRPDDEPRGHPRARARTLTRRYLVPLLVVLAVGGCGGDDAGSTITSGSAEASAPADSGVLRFEQVKSFTLRHLEGEAGVRKQCKELGWVEEGARKRELAPFKGTRTVEVLTCDEVPYVAYVEYRDAAAAKSGLAPARVPYLLVGDVTVAMPLVGLDERTASGYLKALKAKCACGEIVEPRG